MRAGVLLLSILSIYASPASAVTLPRFVRALCPRLLDPARARRARAFEEELRAASYPGVREAERIGSLILEFPGAYLRAAKQGPTTPLAPFMRTPEVAHAFLAANPFNGLVAADLLEVAKQAAPDLYRDAIETAVRTVVLTPAAELKRRFPDFDVPREQARALDLCRWVGVEDRALIDAAFSYLEPGRARLGPVRRLDGLHARAYAAADFIFRRGRGKDVSPERIEWLVARALNLGHPFARHYWTALRSERLTPDQRDRLAHAWASPILTPAERREFRRRAVDLIKDVEAVIRRNPGDFRHLRPS